MTTLWEVLPSAEQVLALEPEELGGVLLPIFAEEQGNRDCFSPSGVVYFAFERPPYPYPQSHRNVVTNAVMEAAAWLESAGLIMPAPDASVRDLQDSHSPRPAPRQRRDFCRVSKGGFAAETASSSADRG
jgi:hypothetical protein